ncbi:MAG: hypothetical protein RR235_07095 [Oscillospiraceae bacterium]
MRKRYILGIPLANISIIICWTIARYLEKTSGYWDNPDAAPISIFTVVVFFLLFGGFALVGLLCGMQFVKIADSATWNIIFGYTILTFVLVEILYILFYSILLNDRSSILRDTAIITLQQGGGFFVGCCIKKAVIKLTQ